VAEGGMCVRAGAGEGVAAVRDAEAGEAARTRTRRAEEGDEDGG
jgi:hypothetical protein